MNFSRKMGGTVYTVCAWQDRARDANDAGVRAYFTGRCMLPKLKSMSNNGH